MAAGNGARSSFWRNFGPILAVVAGGAISIAVAMNTETNTKQDTAIDGLRDARMSIQERLGRIETDIDHVKKSQQDTHDDVKEIRRLLEGRQYGDVR